MARVLAAHQLNFVPWLGFLSKVAQADVFVLADNVQFTKHGYTNRNRIRTADGWQWMTVPVRTRGRSGQTIASVEIENDQPWARKHAQALEWNYSQTPFFESQMAVVAPLLASPPARLAALNLRLLRHLLSELRIDTEIRFSSQMDLRHERSQRLADMAKSCDCDVYLAGEGGSRDYLDEGLLEAAGVEVRYTEFKHPQYPQAFPGFEAGMCGLDLLFNCGPRGAEILKSP